MNTKHNLGKLKETIFIGRMLRGSILALALLAFCFTFIPYFVSEADAASDISTGVRWGSVFLELDPDKAATDAGTSDVGDEGHGDIDFDELIPSQRSGANYGTLKVTKKTIGITSSGKYYTVYISTNSANNNLNLEIGEGSSDTTVRIPALSSTFETPAAFSGTGWGFALPCNSELQTGVDCTLTAANWVTPTLLDTQMTSSSTLDGASATYNTTIWAGVPNNTNPVQIWKAEAQGAAGENYGFGSYEKDGSTVTGDTTNNHFDIYYAVAVDTDTLAGTYSNQIVYTALASASSLDDVSVNMQADKNFGAAKDVQTLKFDLNESTVSINEADMLIKIVPHSVMVAEEYEIANLNPSDYYTCPIVQNSLDFSSNAYAQVSCKIPKGLNVEDGSGNAGYDFWLYIDGYGYNYISRDFFENTQVATYYNVGLQSKYPTGEGTYANGDSLNPAQTTATSRAGSAIVTKMQEMSNGICNNTNAWGNTTSVGAKVYDQTGGGNTLYTTTTDNDSGFGIGTFALIDIRDQKDYLVRRLADGNCWMVQNLDLNLADFAGQTTGTLLTTENTDITTTDYPIGYWDPQNKLLTTDLSSESTVEARLTDMFNDNNGRTQEYQFQSGVYLAYDSTHEYRWASRKSNYSLYSDFARSYDGGLGYTALYDVYDGTSHSRRIRTGISSPYAEAEPTKNYYNDLVNYGVSDWIDGATDTTRNSQTYGTIYVGDYYNWYAATAETGSYANNVSTGSICPKGWQLPVYGDVSVDKSWGKLLFGTYKDIDGNAMESNPKTATSVDFTPISFSRAGYYAHTTGALQSRGLRSIYWSKGSYTVDQMPGSVNVLSDGGKSYGFSIRCVSHGDELTDSATVIAAQDPDPVTTCGANKICYNKNGGTGSMTDQSVTAANPASNTTATLTASSFTKLGYAFAGWSTTENGFGGSLYGPNETITTGDLSSKGLQLYAKWLPSVGTMQNWTGCSTLAEHQTVALTDNRDGNVYTVAKLKDGNCWMTSNLALNLADFAGTKKLTSKNTDIANNNASNTALSVCQPGDECYVSGETNYYWNPSASMFAVAQEAVTANPSKYANASATYGIAESTLLDNLSDYGLTYDSSAAEGSKFTVTDASKFLSQFVTQQNYFYVASEYRLGTVQAAQFQSGDQNGSGWHWGSKCAEAGGSCTESITNNALAVIPRSYSDHNNTYYDYYAFIAESAGYNDLSSAPMSICPSGWMLPHYSGAGSWDEIVNTYSLSNIKTTADLIYQTPFSFTSGSSYGWSAGVVADTGERTYFAISRKDTATIMSYLYASASKKGGSYFNHRAGGNTTNGVAVRCVQVVPTP